MGAANKLMTSVREKKILEKSVDFSSKLAFSAGLVFSAYFVSFRLSEKCWQTDTGICIPALPCPISENQVHLLSIFHKSRILSLYMGLEEEKLATYSSCRKHAHVRSQED